MFGLRRFQAIKPIFRVLISQALALVVVLGGGTLLVQQGVSIPLVSLLAASGVLAAAIGRSVLKLQSWWAVIQVVLPLALGAALWLGLPGWVYLALFGIFLLVYWNSADEQVPLYLTNSETWAELDKIISSRSGGVFADLGCGLGGPLRYLATRYPDMRFVGVETAPIPYFICRLRLAHLSNAEVKFASMWDQDLSQFDVAYCFLSPVPMPRLIEKARQHMKPGSLLISNSFTDPEQPSDETLEVADGRKTQLHVWHMS